VRVKPGSVVCVVILLSLVVVMGYRPAPAWGRAVPVQSNDGSTVRTIVNCACVANK
jgi:hypothetical protein